MSKRIGRLIWDERTIPSLDLLTNEEYETVGMCLDSSPSVIAVEIWRDEEDENKTLMIDVLDDGMHAIGRFDAQGKLVGDWIV